MTGWVPDVLPGYWQRTIDLGPDPAGEGDIAATLIRRGEPAGSGRRAVLAVHGYTDYFFNTALADHFAERGFAFYALDLQKCGRSRRDGQTPHFITDLAHYDAELGQALSVIREGTAGRVLVYGHSSGGLIVALWLDRLRRRDRAAHAGVGALVLNSPFLDLHGPAVLRTSVTTALLAGLSRVWPRGVVRAPTEGGYGTTLHRDYQGEFDYDLRWKPVGGFPITVGWVHAVRRGQSRLHRGLDVGVPNLILRSDHSVRESADPASMQCGDAVLDVTQIAKWAGCIGNRTSVVVVPDAKHDVFLSLPRPRDIAYRQLDVWLDDYLGAESTPASSGKG